MDKICPVGDSLYLILTIDSKDNNSLEGEMCRRLLFFLLETGSVEKNFEKMVTRNEIF